MKRLIALTLVLSVIYGGLTAVAEDRQVFIICNPESFVNVHRTPKMSSEKAGRLECGDDVLTDGKKKNGFLHVLNVTEYGEGWVYMGYVVDEPVIKRTCYGIVAASGRAKARRYINGKKNAWLDVGSEIKVLAYCESWAVTKKGFVDMNYLELWYE